MPGLYFSKQNRPGTREEIEAVVDSTPDPTVEKAFEEEAECPHAPGSSQLPSLSEEVSPVEDALGP